MKQLRSLNSRRTFLWSMIGVLIVLPAAGCKGLRITLSTGCDSLGQVYSALSPASELGRLYFELRGGTLTPKDLMKELELSEAICNSTAARFYAVYQKRISGDFASERTVTLNGWLVSQTEARLFALIHLLVSK